METQARAQRVKSAELFTPWDPGLRQDDVPDRVNDTAFFTP
jgi:hypothetical protein